MALKLLAATMLLFATLSVPPRAFATASPATSASAATSRATVVMRGERPIVLAAGEASREIGALLSLLRVSTCRFERNGRWYDGERAADHLQRKLDYATGRGRVPASSEQFIDEAATRSSFSGREYRVQCGDAAPMSSRVWFLAALRQLRTPG